MAKTKRAITKASPKKSSVKSSKKLETKQILLRPNNPARGLILMLMRYPQSHEHYRLGGAVASALRSAGANEDCLRQIAENAKEPTVFKALVQCVVALQGYRSVGSLQLTVRIQNNLRKYFNIPPSGRVESIAALRRSQLSELNCFGETELGQLQEALRDVGLDFAPE